MAKKKSVKKISKTPEELFAKWWDKSASKKVAKIEKNWIKENEPNDSEDEGGDHWHVNEMMHNGDAFEMTYEIAERVFLLGFNKEKWEFNMGDSLFCDLDEVISEAYEAGKNSK